MADRETILAHLGEIAAARPATTTRSYEKGWTDWSRWASQHAMRSLPADPDDLAEWLVRLADRVKPATVKLYARGVAAAHADAGVPDPLIGRAAVALRVYGTVGEQRQARPVCGDEIPRLLDVLDGDCYRARMRALILTMRYGMLRRSEAAALRWTDLHLDSDGPAVIVLHQTKTSKTPVRRWLPAEAAGALTEWLRSAPDGDELIFGWSAASIGRHISAAAGAAGLDGVTGHSLRRGMVTDLLAAGAPVSIVMEAGRWRSESMVARYAAGAQASRAWIEAVATTSEKVT